MAVRLVPDVMAPLAVTAVDLVTETAAPNWNEGVAYIMAVGGYVGAFMGFGGDFIKNIGIASFPWAAKKLYDRVRGGAASRMSYRRVSAPGPERVSRSYQPEMESAAAY